MTTKGQRLWLGTRRVCMEWVLSELSSWTYLSFCFLTWVQQGAALCQLHESTPTGLCSKGKQCMDIGKHCFTLFFPWKWEWDLWMGFGSGDESEPIDSERVSKTGVHLSKWSSSLLFLLEWGKDGAGGSLYLKLVSPRSRSQDNDWKASN